MFLPVCLRRTGGDRTTALALLDEADETVESRPHDAPSGLFTVEAT
ncbi:hypothetical protein [Streptomyces roseolus]